MYYLFNKAVVFYLNLVDKSSCYLLFVFISINMALHALQSSLSFPLSFNHLKDFLTQLYSMLLYPDIYSKVFQSNQHALEHCSDCSVSLLQKEK